MKKDYLILLVITLAIGAALFYDQVLDIFAGMTPLEAMQQIVTFMLHIAVVTILWTVALGLPKIIKPWMRMLRHKRRAMRRGQVPQQVSKPRAPRVNKDQVLYWLMMQSMKNNNQSVNAPRSGDEHQINLDF